MYTSISGSTLKHPMAICYPMAPLFAGSKHFTNAILIAPPSRASGCRLRPQLLIYPNTVITRGAPWIEMPAQGYWLLRLLSQLTGCPTKLPG